MANKAKSKVRKGAWFVKLRGSYLPVNTAGWLTYVPYIVYLALTVVIAINDIDNISVAVLFIVPNWIAATVLLTWIAAQKS